jgi:hypothetical protein
MIPVSTKFENRRQRREAACLALAAAATSSAAARNLSLNAWLKRLHSAFFAGQFVQK